MENKNRLLIAAAGSGKTTYLIKEALKIKDEKVLITTYTRSNAKEIRSKIKELNHGVIPDNIIIEEWFTFLLKHGVKPYKSYMEDELKYKNIGFHLSQEKSGFRYYVTDKKLGKKIPIYFGEKDFFKYYFTTGLKIYSDKTSQFICTCNQKSGGLVCDRISKVYPNIFIDEVQDLAGWDLELLKLFFKSNSQIVLVGDPRQTVYLTNNSGKHPAYKNGQIIKFVTEKCKSLKVQIDLETLNSSHRNNRRIVDFSSLLYPDYPSTSICNCEEHQIQNSHEGIFLVRERDVPSYLEEFNPQILRYEKSKLPELNFGVAKGLAFDRVLIYPTKGMQDWLTGSKIDAASTLAKFYVAITRARNSVAILYNYTNENFRDGITKYKE